MAKLLTILAAAAGLPQLTTASPIESFGDIKARQVAQCPSYPWFLVPYADSYQCQGTPQLFQPTSGPFTADPINTLCAPLSGGQPGPQNFLSVAANPVACSPMQNWKINLYIDDPDCTTQPIAVTSGQCVAALNGCSFTNFDAILM
ncbi:hypothetical protein H2204_007584 [Knufia peltigerae]|uniref:Uncharacterized protein n=1 Tax=Knufia peltigerae TaxID=1002370 RepID=A0AA38Y2W9_9EURO|nr:hypothetical protein H2204_007584 [Knufia peltigerae]